MRPRLLVALLITTLGASGCGHSSGVRRLALRLPPYLGVGRIIKKNKIACDRVDLAVWLTKTAFGFTVTIAGLPVKMRIPVGFEPTPYLGPRAAYWEGFLQPAGLKTGRLRVRPDRGRYTWYGRHPVHATVRIAAYYRDVSRAAATVRVLLHAGWG